MTGLEFRLRDGTVLGAGDAAVYPRRYRPLADLLVANAEILSAAVMACPAHVVTPDGELTVTTPTA